MSRNIYSALAGWVGGAITTVLLGFVWPVMFPAIVNVENYYGDGPSILTIVGITLLVMSPASLIGGFFGGRISIEGGVFGQRIIAAVFGALFMFPFGCVVFMYFTGWGFGIS